MSAFHLTRYMLVDSEEDNKTHRPVAPKEVRLSSCSLVYSQFVLKLLLIAFPLLGPKEVNPVSW